MFRADHNVQFPTEYFASADELLKLKRQIDLLKQQVDSLTTPRPINATTTLTPILREPPVRSMDNHILKGKPPKPTYHDEFGNEFFKK